MKYSVLSFLFIIFMVTTSDIIAADIVKPKGIIVLDGRLAPELKLKDMDENPFDLTTLRGKWVFVHFWATWCGPCRKEMPTINAIYPIFKDSQLEIVIINTAESEDIIFSFLGIAAPDIASLLDKDGLTTERWQPRGLPSTFFVDPKGRLRYLALGGRPWDEPKYIKFLKDLSKH